LIVKGLPRAPEVRHSVDLAFAKSPLRRFAVSGDGSVVLLAFAGEGSDVLYSWSTASGAHFIGKISRISALAFMGEDAVVADSGLNQIILIRSVRTHAIPELIADSRAGISKPSALFVSSRDEIHVGNADTIVTLNAKGQPLRKAVCACAISMMEKFGDSSIQLTKDLERPIFVLDESSVPERILFIPALTALPATKR
jgi:hypothetical protein